MNFYIGLTPANEPSNETGVCILDEKLNIIHLDRFMSTKEFSFFIDNLSNKSMSTIMVSIPMAFNILDSKWKLNAQKTVLNDLNCESPLKKWNNLYSDKLCNILTEYKDEFKTIYRYNIKQIRMMLNLQSPYISHSSADCKFLQNALKLKFNISPIINNLYPVTQLEAILGAYCAYLIANNKKEIKVDKIFKNIQIVKF